MTTTAGAYRVAISAAVNSSGDGGTSGAGGAWKPGVAVETAAVSSQTATARTTPHRLRFAAPDQAVMSAVYPPGIPGWTWNWTLPAVHQPY